MTPQEAINELKEEMEVFKEGIDTKALKNPDAELKKVLEANDLAIKALEQIMWIPVSERLPEEDGLYLVTGIDIYFGEYKPFILKREKTSPSNLAKWVGVVAWMPLPEPYKESEENDSN